MRKVKEIKEEIHEVIERLSSLAKELHVSEYVDAGEDDTPVHIVMGRKLATVLYGYVAGTGAMHSDEAFEAAACVSQSLRLPLAELEYEPAPPEMQED